MITLASIEKESSLRQIYHVLLVLCAVGIFVASLTAGISGDEPVHYQHGGFVNAYYSSGHQDVSALETPITNLKYYGQVFDNLTWAVNSLFSIESPYTTRHIINGLLGFLLIFFTTRIAFYFKGYLGAIIALLLMTLSPKIFGHSLNNLKDIPFALGYVVAIWGMLGIQRAQSTISYRHYSAIALGFGIALGTRAGGLILVPMVLLFVVLSWLQKLLQKELSFPKSGLFLLQSGALLIGVLALGYLLGIIYWPYALEDPLRHPWLALKMMTNYEVSIRQVFNGEWLWSEKLPWYYGPKWIFISSPLIVFVGFLSHFVWIKIKEWPQRALLYFSLLFPILWIWIQGSNLYGGWRHLLFVYPLLVIGAAEGLAAFAKLKPKGLFSFLMILILVGSLWQPTKHIIKNHPVQYVYFNVLAGGMDKAQGRYETDYYFSGLRSTVQWVKDNKLASSEASGKIILASNFPLEHYFTDRENVEVKYMNYYDRGKHAWDYALFSSTYIDPQQLQLSSWPPSNTINQKEIDAIPVAIVLERKSTDDLLGLAAYRQSDFASADSLFNACLQLDADNETARLYLAWTYRHLNDIPASNAEVNKLMINHPQSDTGKDLLARNAILLNDFVSAEKYLLLLLKQNYKYLPAYEQLGVVYSALNKPKKQAAYLKAAYSLGLNSKEHLQTLIEALQKAGDPSQAAKFISILNNY